MATTTDPAVFARNLRTQWTHIERMAVMALNDVCFEFWKLSVEGTRRDTGQCQAGYILSVGSPSTEVPGRGTHPPPNPSRFVHALESAGLKVTRFLTNGVGHWFFLEVGTSQRAGDHMVELAKQSLIARGLAKAA